MLQQRHLNKYLLRFLSLVEACVNTGATRYGRGQHKTGSFGDDMLRPSPNHGTQRLPNDEDDEACKHEKTI